MAKNREPVKPVEESESEESDEEGSTEADSEESDSEPEPPQSAAQKKPPLLPVRPQQPPPPQNQPASSSDEDDETESESDSDTEMPLRDSVVKTPAAKPKEEPQKARSKPSAADAVTPAKSAAVKRPSEDTEVKEAKKSKKTAEPESSEKKSTLFSRFWSEEDEIIILNGMIEFAAQNKSDPISDLNGFYDFIKKKLTRDFTKTQLQHKIKRLKKKYENNKGKEEKDGKERTLSNKHEQRAYDLSKELWGNETMTEKRIGSPKSNAKSARKTPNKKAAVENGDVKDVKNAVLVRSDGDPSLSMRMRYHGSGVANTEEMMLMDGIKLYENGKVLEGGDEWEKLRVEELELYQKYLELRTAQTKLVLSIMKGRDH